MDTIDRDDVQVKRGGFATQNDATAVLEHVRELIAVAAGDDRIQRRIASTIIERSKRGGTLPSVDEVRQKYGAGLDPIAPSMTLGQWLDEWLTTKRRASESTVESYRDRIELVWKPHLGEMPLDRLSGSHIVGVLDWFERRNRVIQEAIEAGKPVPRDPLDKRHWQQIVGAETQRQIVGVLAMALNAAVRRRLLTFNPRDEIEMPNKPKPDTARVWAPEQVVKFVTATVDHRLGALFRLVLLRGPRRGEACGLQWADIDLERGQVEIKRTMRFAGPKRGIALGKPKTESSKRTISLDRGTLDALRKVKLRQRQERLAAGVAWRGPSNPELDWVFAAPDGFPTPPTTVTRTFMRLAAKHSLPVIRLHDGRHTAATLGFEAGLDIKLVSVQLGHSGTAITQDLYTHVRRARQDAAAETVETFLFGDNGTAMEQTSANLHGRR
ncbi:tyrosine-type recombinase/integrase [Umezawaea endophytica]|uniref:Site-specific integrase n=1 Tax=Umezawaea endophytica TaxID=1654476 RepID=A0A9X3AFR9_9PSEU|nr:site-specific integrase [Umezawaea endophytica]MCS7477495.1 site-specific integrase [Umezawaea endophytica]